MATGSIAVRSQKLGMQQPMYSIALTYCGGLIGACTTRNGFLLGVVVQDFREWRNVPETHSSMSDVKLAARGLQ